MPETCPHEWMARPMILLDPDPADFRCELCGVAGVECEACEGLDSLQWDDASLDWIKPDPATACTACHGAGIVALTPTPKEAP